PARASRRGAADCHEEGDRGCYFRRDETPVTHERFQMSEIHHIVFDIGKVLIHYDPELPFRRLIPDDGKRARFLGEICTGEWNVEQDRGRSWNEAEALLIDKHPDEEEMIRAFRRHWHEMVPHAYDGSVA